jgi:CO/xanthine dehydrogenase FAD-binding subunit
MEYILPQNVNDALHVMKKWKGRAKLIAGATNVIPDMRAKILKPGALIDISHLKNLSYIKEEKKRIRIGGLTTISDLVSSKVIQDHAPLLSDAANQLGNPLVRNRATIAGNLADASPAADTAVPLLVLEAVVVAERDGRKRRQIPIDQFFLGVNQTVLKPGEMIKEVLFLKPDPNRKTAYIKLGRRNAMAISVVSVAALLEIDGSHCRKARLGFGAVAPKPIRVYRIEGMLTDREITEELIEACCEKVGKEISPITDIRASAEYRRSMASVLLRRALQQILCEGMEWKRR